jgi:hypothetical protein
MGKRSSGMPSVRVVDEVLLHEEQGEAFLLHVPSGRYFGLNRSGVVVWSALRAGEDPVDAMQAEWPARDRAGLEADVKALLDALLTAGLARAA